MIKKIFLLFCLLTLVSCGVKNNSKLTGKKSKTKELVSKEQYRAQQKKVEEQRRIQDEAKREKDKRTAAKTSETLEATSRISVTADMIQDYILQYKDIAKDNMSSYGIPASITLAQGVLESGSGQGTLSRNANNHFGIKCHKEWDGPSVRHTDDAPDECFRKYEAPEESYRDHSQFLVSRSRYNDLFALDKDDYEGWAHGLKKAGYATDPKYANKLISLIERYTLDQYDREVLGLTSPRPKKEIEKKAEVKVDTKAKVDAKSTSKTHVVQKGDTLYSISKKYNTTVAKLQKSNNLDGTNLSIGQRLKL
ncbi:glucosaminidase domain-containing protein [Myroides sp. 1354]|uniref:glucosaminidase domain-containing protein n=1 Tax=unclassified Myroides TaxID=2642485 RepID=UPI0025774FF2|nr:MULTISPECIES: glucosaminidase domain-containing protein [unclassified Myroides]MDM1043888.1 glucosaminidase domain-containing protein [Myroides sp. R163-1]MDM1054823.1 glucosaminidase domain-containing protein [Myroides sp. 1354]MDM1068120.1 glucosaminidase domain-containing protein [Myroides sp. 1372]